MLDKLPIELISQELIRHVQKGDEYALMLTCKSTHYATKEHFRKTYKPKPTLICFDNPIHHDIHYRHLSRTWAYKKSRNCSTDNYYSVGGTYRTLDTNYDTLMEEYNHVVSKL